MEETYKGRLKNFGNSGYLLVPSFIIRKYDLNLEDELEITIKSKKNPNPVWTRLKKWQNLGYVLTKCPNPEHIYNIIT